MSPREFPNLLHNCIDQKKLTAMETSQPLSIESFSYSWLVNLNPSLENLENSLRPSLDASDEASNSFIEMDPRMPPSKRFFFNNNNSQDFKFDFPHDDDDEDGLVDADELFSNGYIMPLFVNSLKMDSDKSSDSMSKSVSLPPSSSQTPKGTSRCPSLKRCRTLSRRVVHKYLSFLRPLCRRLMGHTRNQKPGSDFETAGKRGDSTKKKQKKNKGSYNSEASPRISVAYDNWRRSCDSESSIYEAVLHCKRSIERMN